MRSWLWRSTLAVAIALPALGVAARADAGCSVATLQGQYLVYGTGTLFPPAFGVTVPSVSTVASYSTYFGNGNGEDHVTFAIDGVVQTFLPAVQPFTYTLKPDCTGTRTVTGGPEFAIYVASDGEALTEVATSPAGFAVATFDKRVGNQDTQ